MREILLVLAVALGTYALRASMIVRTDATPLPDVARRGLRYLSPAILAALITSALLLGPEGNIVMQAAPLVAAAAATLVAARTSSIPLIVVAGIAAHELTRWLL